MARTIDGTLLHLLHRASQVADDIYISETEGLDLTPRQFVVLAAIEEQDGPSQSDIVARTGVDRSTLADITKRLVKKKLIARRRSRSDARAYVISITAEGHAQLSRAHAAAMATEGVLQSALSVHEVGSLITMLNKVATLKPEPHGIAQGA